MASLSSETLSAPLGLSSWLATINTEGGNVDANKFTPGALPVSTGNAEIPVTHTPAPTEAAIPMTFVMPDGLIIAATYYNASSRTVGTVLLLHMLGSNKESWRSFAAQLQPAGYNALAVDLRVTAKLAAQWIGQRRRAM